MLYEINVKYLAITLLTTTSQGKNFAKTDDTGQILVKL